MRDCFRLLIGCVVVGSLVPATAQLPGVSYAISGRIRTAQGQGISGVLISLSSGISRTTDGTGTYFIPVASGFSGTAIPSLAGYSFSPPSLSYSAINSDVSNQDYMGTPSGPSASTFTIAGTVRTSSGQAVAGVTISFSNGGPSTSTDGSGNYAVIVSAGFSGSATPILSGFTFSPISRPYSNVSNSQSGQDYSATPSVSTAGYTISGAIRTNTGQAIPGVNVSFSNGGPSTFTDGGGSYAATVPTGYNGTATPNLSGYVFSPPSLLYRNVSSNQSGQDYSGTPPVSSEGYTISGTIRMGIGQGIAGVSVSFSDGGPSTFTDGGGSYAVTVPTGYNGTATPNLSGYVFSPPSLLYRNVSGNLSAQDYSGTASVSSGGYTISGTVRTITGQGISGALVSLTDGGPNVLTDANGDYVATVAAGYNGSATPILSGYTFSPTSRAYSNVGTNQSGQDYFGTPPVSAYTISGTVRTAGGQAIGGVRITFSNGGPSVSSDVYGNYFATPAREYSGTATPILSGYAFNPASRTYVGLNSDGSGHDYTGTPTSTSYTVSGTVRNAAGQGMSGVTILFSNGPSVSTDSVGNYVVTLSSGYSGLATPSIAGYRFTPTSRSYSSVNANRVGDDYIAAGATTYPIFSLGPIPSGCTPPTAVNEVPATTASRIYAWLPVQGTSGDPYYFDWYDPASKQYARGSGVFSFSGTGCTWSSIDASGATLLGLRGLWRVEYWQNNILRNSNTFQLLESSAAPTITAITHAATSAVGPVAPGELITIYGTNLGLPTLTPLKVAASGLVESTLAGSRILFDGVAAPLLYARNDQLGAIVPYSVAGKQSTKVQALFFGSQSSTVDLRVMASAPGLFTLNQQGFGQAAMFNENGSINSASNPANKNSAVVFYATGEGQTLPAGVDGRITQADLRRPIASVSLTIGGQLAEIYYAGAAPTLVSGLMQINARVPPNITGGESVPVVLTVGGFSSRSGVTMAVRQ